MSEVSATTPALRTRNAERPASRVLTAICPHLLTIRPIVVPGQSEITVTVDVVPHETYLTVDGQEAVELLLNDRIRCRRSERFVKLLRLRPNGIFNVLRSKLSWGEQ